MAIYFAGESKLTSLLNKLGLNSNADNNEDPQLTFQYKVVNKKERKEIDHNKSSMTMHL